MKTLYACLWTVVIIIGYLLVLPAINKPMVKTGTEIPISLTNGQTLVTKTGVSIKAGGCSFFQLRNVDNDALVTAVKQSEVPIGMDCSVYYKVPDSQSQLAEGKWFVQDGNPDVRITNQELMTVQIIQSEADKVGNGVMALLIALVVWLIGLAAIVGNRQYS